MSCEAAGGGKLPEFIVCGLDANAFIGALWPPSGASWLAAFYCVAG